MLRKVIRVTVSLSIFVLVLRAVNPREVIQGFRELSALYLFATLGMVLVDSLLRSGNWRQLLSRFTPLGFRQAWLAYLAGAFYGSLIPSTVGTDIARAAMITQRAPLDMRVAVGTLVTLNILGLAAVGVLGMIATIVLLLSSQTTFLIVDLVLSGGLALVVGVLLFTEIGRRRRCRRFPRAWD
jgi:hypothetical protein